MKFEQRFAAREMRVEENNKTQIVSGYAAVFKEPTLIGGIFWEQILPGAFSRSIGAGDVRALRDHRSELLLGRTKSKTLELAEDARGLKFKLLLPDSPTGDDAAESVRRGDLSGCSFGFEVRQDAWAKGKTPKGDATIRSLKDVELHEVSLCAFPAYQTTSAEMERSLWPAGIPSELRSHFPTLGRTKLRLADPAPCECSCEDCQGGDCVTCSNEACDDPNCMCAERKLSDPDRAARRRRLAIEALEL